MEDAGKLLERVEQDKKVVFGFISEVYRGGKGDEMHPFAVICTMKNPKTGIGGDAPHHVFIDHLDHSSDEAKDRTVGIIRWFARKIDGYAIFTGSEAWMAQLPVEGKDKREVLRDLPRVSEHPNRVEVVLVTVNTTMFAETYMARIRRENGLAFLETWESFPVSEGRLANLMDAPEGGRA